MTEISSIAIVGATSLIARRLIRRYARHGMRLLLVGRNRQALEAVAADAVIRGARSADVFVADLADLGCHDAVEERIAKNLCDTIIVAHGVLDDQTSISSVAEDAVRNFNVNAVSYVGLMIRMSNYLEGREEGRLAVFSSVAGERGRYNVGVYGAAKSAVTQFASALRQRFNGRDIVITTIKPGPVYTPMLTASSTGLLTADADRVARDIERAIRIGKRVCYTPGYWRLIMWVVRMIPESVFVKLKF